MKYIRTKDGKIIDISNLKMITDTTIKMPLKENGDYVIGYYKGIEVIKESDTIEGLLDEIVFIENGEENNVVYLPEAKDRLDDYHYAGNYEPRLIGRIKVGLDKKAVAEWKELTEGDYKGCYDWVLL